MPSFAGTAEVRDDDLARRTTATPATRCLRGCARRSAGPATGAADRAEAEAYVAAHAHGPRPTMAADLVERFIRRATDMESTVERIADRREIPAAVARYLDALVLPPALAAQKSHAGVCWPEFADLDWAGAGLAIEARPTVGDDRLGITGAFCAIAETGTLVVLAGADTPTATALLVDTHVAVVRADRIVSGMEEAFALVRRERGRLAARGQSDLGPVAHRRHRADDRARRARTLPRAHPRARLAGWSGGLARILGPRFIFTWVTRRSVAYGRAVSCLAPRRPN